MRTHVCKNPTCKAAFTKQKPGQKACSMTCAIIVGRLDREKKAKSAERKEYRERKTAMKTLRDWLNDAQIVCNAYVRERDRDLPCISCGTMNATWNAGHYRSVAAAPGLRFNEDNIHKQCVACNQHKSGNAIEYRIGLKARIGEARVEALECFNEVVKRTIDDAKAVISEYKLKLKELINERR